MICTAMMPAFVADEVVTSAERKYKGNTEVCLGDVGLHGLCSCGSILGMKSAEGI